MDLRGGGARRSEGSLGEGSLGKAPSRSPVRSATWGKDAHARGREAAITAHQGGNKNSLYWDFLGFLRIFLIFTMDFAMKLWSQEVLGAPRRSQEVLGMHRKS